MALDPFISVDDLEAMLGESVPDPNALIVKIALDSACQAVRTYIGQDVNYVADDVEVHSGSGRRKLRLRQRPVRGVTEVKVDDEIVDPAEYKVVGHTIVLPEDTWTPGNANVEVTYSHGWDVDEPTEVPVPADLRLVALLASRRVYTDARVDATEGAIIKESIGDYSYELSSEAGAAVLSASELLVAEKMVLDRYAIQLVGDSPTQ